VKHFDDVGGLQVEELADPNEAAEGSRAADEPLLGALPILLGRELRSAAEEVDRVLEDGEPEIRLRLLRTLAQNLRQKAWCREPVEDVFFGIDCVERRR
jgi:hypothetical protein